MIGGLGVQELLIVFFIALILFGGKRLPEIGQNLGKALRGFKDSSEKAMDELHRENTAQPASTAPKEEESPPEAVATDREDEAPETPAQTPTRTPEKPAAETGPDSPSETVAPAKDA